MSRSAFQQHWPRHTERLIPSNWSIFKVHTVELHEQGSFYNCPNLKLQLVSYKLLVSLPNGRSVSRKVFLSDPKDVKWILKHFETLVAPLFLACRCTPEEILEVPKNAPYALLFLSTHIVSHTRRSLSCVMSVGYSWPAAIQFALLISDVNLNFNSSNWSSNV